MEVYSAQQLAEYYGLKPLGIVELIEYGFLHPLVYGAKHLIFQEDELLRGLPGARYLHRMKTHGKEWKGPFGPKPEPFYVADPLNYGSWNRETPTLAGVEASEDQND